MQQLYVLNNSYASLPLEKAMTLHNVITVWKKVNLG